MKKYILKINVNYDEIERILVTLLVPEKETHKETLSNIERAKYIIDTFSPYDNYEDYEDEELTRKEFETISNVYDGCNEITFMEYLEQMYGYKCKGLETDFEITID